MLVSFLTLLFFSNQAEPYVAVLGTAQDGGLPQIGCTGPQCSMAIADPAHKRLISSLLVVDPGCGKRWLIDATPDIREQAARISQIAGLRKSDRGRPPIVDGVFLTHAHIGHYSGLVFFGREAYSHPKIPVYGSERMKSYLTKNGPWSLLVENGNIEPQSLTPGKAFQLCHDLEITPFHVPHRDEFTDTFGYKIRGPKRALLFIPDIDKWEKWSIDINKKLDDVDVALLDGTFFAEGEIPGRAMADIPHPFITESLKRFGGLPESTRKKVVFIHLNHTNPAANPKSKASEMVRQAGMRISIEGQIFNL